MTLLYILKIAQPFPIGMKDTYEINLPTAPIETALASCQWLMTAIAICTSLGGGCRQNCATQR